MSMTVYLVYERTGLDTHLCYIFGDRESSLSYIADRQDTDPHRRFFIERHVIYQCDTNGLRPLTYRL